MPSRARLSIRQAIALGALQGPTELLPVSSSAHTTLIPWLTGSSYPELDPELRKSFEVALHAGAAVALTLDMRRELIDSARGLSRRRLAVIALSLGPPALAGYALERPIERQLGGPRSIAAGLIAGGLAMALADRRGGRGLSGQGRGQDEAGPADGLALGIAQVAALAPGVSRNGATLTAARTRGFTREDAQTLSWHAGLPVILGASALKVWRLWRDGAPGGANAPLAVGTFSAFVSTAVAARALRRPRVRASTLLPFALYRCTIAAVTIMRLRKTQNMREMRPPRTHTP